MWYSCDMAVLELIPSLARAELGEISQKFNRLLGGPQQSLVGYPVGLIDLHRFRRRSFADLREAYLTVGFSTQH